MVTDRGFFVKTLPPDRRTGHRSAIAVKAWRSSDNDGRSPRVIVLSSVDPQ